MDFENLSFLIVLWEMIAINVLLLLAGLWRILRSRKAVGSHERESFGWMLVGSPILLFGFFLTARYSPPIADLINDLWVLPILLILLPALVLVYPAFIGPLRSHEGSIKLLISQNRISAFTGMFFYFVLLFLALYIYQQNLESFGSDYSRMDWEFYYDEAKTLQSLWAFGFLLPFSPHFLARGIILLYGLAAPILFAVNGLLWSSGQKISATLISIHLFMLYVALPIVLAVLIADP